MERENILTEMPKRNPVNGTFELTVRCNLRCKMCLFRHDDRENPELIAKELTAEQWIDMARQVAEAGTLSLLITGGEPMLRPDFCEIWEGIYKQGFIIELYTNATMVTPKIMDTLRKYPPHKIGVTIYGASPETYERVCGNADAYERTIAGIRQLRQLPSEMRYRTTVIQDNRQDVEAMEQLVRREAGENVLLTNTRLVTKGVRGACADVESCRLSAQESFDLVHERTIRRVFPGKENRDEGCLKYVKLPQSEKKWLTLLGCNAGMNSYTITWDGKLQGCQILGAFQTDVVRLGFKDAWDRFPMEVKLPPKNQKCISCELKHLCECCPAFVYSETGSLQGVPKYICDNTKMIHKVLGGCYDEK